MIENQKNTQGEDIEDQSNMWFGVSVSTGPDGTVLVRHLNYMLYSVHPQFLLHTNVPSFNEKKKETFCTCPLALKNLSFDLLLCCSSEDFVHVLMLKNMTFVA